MNTKAFIVFSMVLSLLLLFANTIDARKDLGEILRKIMNNQDMPESIPEDSEHKTEKAFGKSFELTPDTTIYDNDIKPTKQKAFCKDFNLMPDISIYDNGVKPTKQRVFVENLEVMPDVTIYGNDIKPMKPNEMRS